ncbi:hypothetical protein DPEC_G00228500 [Dallia pectoralis]|uniref:Uncharacterized protein n=1 Tax=Dallia pectoralis TaxID=75939 RepID=A0ACC2G189_DALPE|nr:hypothetical protein DPEC_G00228500 [Dallia pectoralis]
MEEGRVTEGGGGGGRGVCFYSGVRLQSKADMEKPGNRKAVWESPAQRMAPKFTPGHSAGTARRPGAGSEPLSGCGDPSGTQTSKVVQWHRWGSAQIDPVALFAPEVQTLGTDLCF